MVKVYIPDDTASISLFSDEIAKVISLEAQKREINIKLIRNGSRGLFRFEPLVEVENENGRFAFGPVTINNVSLLFENNVFSNNFPNNDNGSVCLNNGGIHDLTVKRDTSKENKNYFLNNFSNDNIVNNSINNNCSDAKSINHIFLGEIENIHQFKIQSRLVFKRVGLIDPLSLEDYKNNDGLSGLKNALNMDSHIIIETLKKSGLRGRGGAGFPVGLKWETVLNTPSDVKYIVCNADEGDSGTFADRMLLEGDPFTVIEGMIIAGVATFALQGYVYLRSEYFKAAEKLKKALKLSYKEGLLGENILGTDKRFDIKLIIGAGSYVCGEETALLESIENRRGLVRVRPPVPAISGLYNKPTVLNNVTTFASAAYILSQKNFERIDNPKEYEKRKQDNEYKQSKKQEGIKEYKEHIEHKEIKEINKIKEIKENDGKNNSKVGFSLLGTEISKGTMPFQLSGAVNCPGIYELPMGISLMNLLDTGTHFFEAANSFENKNSIKDIEKGFEKMQNFNGSNSAKDANLLEEESSSIHYTFNGKRLKAVQIGGPLGAYLPITDEFLDMKLSYEGVAEKGGILGHGGVVVFDENTDMKFMLMNTLEFCADESCGKCTPCRIGSIRLKELFERVLNKQNVENNLKIISEILETMKELSLCGLGSSMHYPIESLLKYFKEEILD